MNISEAAAELYSGIRWTLGDVQDGSQTWRLNTFLHEFKDQNNYQHKSESS